MATYTVRPISDRTAFGHGGRKPSQFKVSYSQVVELLDRELEFLKARSVVLEVDIRELDIRLDGQIRADARASSSAVRLAFDSPLVGELTYATDVFYRDATWYWSTAVDGDGKRKRKDTMRHDWQHNLYAIAKSLEALRMVDRYGVTKRGEQYTGFKALPAGRAMPASHMTRTEAAELLERVAIGDEGRNRELTVQNILTSPTHAREVWQYARRMVHPDRRAGDRTMWDQVEQAAAVLGVSS